MTDGGACIEWPFARDKNGYGVKTWQGRQWRAHRLVFEMFHQVDLGDLHLRHKCDNPPCVNPDHLEPGTNADNARDKATRGRARNQYTQTKECVRGHEFTASNTYINPSSGSRQCRACRLADNRRRRHLSRA